MQVRLKYRQGSFPQEELRWSEQDAIARVAELLNDGRGCAVFEIVNEKGQRLRDDSQIRHACARLCADTEPDPPLAA